MPAQPIFTASTTQAALGRTITFTADPALILDPPTPLWDMGNGVHLSGNPLVYSYPRAGTFPVILTATEVTCTTAALSAPTQIAVVEPQGCGPEPPPGGCCGDGVCDNGEDAGSCPWDCAAFSVSAGGPYGGAPNENIQFLGTVETAPGEPILQQTWDFGDGTTAEGTATPTHAYSAPGDYVVRFTAVTDRNSGSATAVASTGSGSSTGNTTYWDWCGNSEEFGCQHDERFLWESWFRGWDAHVSFRLITSWVRANYSPAVGIKITGPGGLTAVERIVRSAGFEVSDDLWDFEWAYGTDPRPGRWQMELSYVYEQRPGAPNPWVSSTFVTVAKLKLEAVVTQCSGDLGWCVLYVSDERPLEGAAGEVYVYITNPDPGMSYAWYWRLGFLNEWDVAGNGPPNPNMSSPYGTYIRVRPKWIAWPDVMVPVTEATELKQRYTHSRYVFGLPPWSYYGASEARITPQVPWGEDPQHSLYDSGGRKVAGYVEAPELILQSALFAQGTDGRWVLDPAEAIFVRIVGTKHIVDSMIAAQSEFLPKVNAHEDDHVDFSSNPFRCGSKYMNVEDGRAFLRSCAADPTCGSGATQLEAQQRLLSAWYGWKNSEVSLFHLFADTAEAEAYAVSNQIPPFYIFQTNDAWLPCLR